MKLSCGIIPFRHNGKSLEFLLLRCFRNWDFPKGMKEEGETPLDAAKRELMEETGISEVRILSPELFVETESYSHGKVARYYPGEISAEEKVKLTPNPVTGILEHQEYRWLTSDEAGKLLVPRIQRVLDWAVAELLKENI